MKCIMRNKYSQNKYHVSVHWFIGNSSSAGEVKECGLLLGRLLPATLLLHGLPFVLLLLPLLLLPFPILLVLLLLELRLHPRLLTPLLLQRLNVLHVGVLYQVRIRLLHRNSPFGALVIRFVVAQLESRRRVSRSRNHLP